MISYIQEFIPPAGIFTVKPAHSADRTLHVLCQYPYLNSLLKSHENGKLQSDHSSSITKQQLIVLSLYLYSYYSYNTSS